MTSPTGSRTVEIVVPGSISNLGPGFDAIAVAIRLFLRLRIVDVREDERDTLDCRFDSGGIGGENRIVTAFGRARAVFGLSTPGLTVEVTAGIPPRAGLGSSGAATVAGLWLYERITGRRPPDGWLALAAAIEGHPDNAAASLLGGLTMACQHEDGRVSARALRWPDSIRLVIATPRLELATSVARRILPPAVPLRDAVFNLQHALLLVDAVRCGDAAAIGDALRDRWHQAARAPLVPGLQEVLALRDPALLGACLSGAGPTVVTVTTAEGERRAVELLTGLYADIGVPCRVMPVGVHQPPYAGAVPDGRSPERILT